MLTDARLREVEHQVHLVQTQLAEVVGSPAVVLGGEPRAHEEGRDAAFL